MFVPVLPITKCTYSLQEAPFDTDQMRNRYNQLEKSMESRERSYKQRIAGLEQQVWELNMQFGCSLAIRPSYALMIHERIRKLQLMLADHVLNNCELIPISLGSNPSAG